MPALIDLVLCKRDSAAGNGRSARLARSAKRHVDGHTDKAAALAAEGRGLDHGEERSDAHDLPFP